MSSGDEVTHVIPSGVITLKHEEKYMRSFFNLFMYTKKMKKVWTPLNYSKYQFHKIACKNCKNTVKYNHLLSIN